MEKNKGFSTNTLINALRSIFEHSKEKFPTDVIQEIMNLITDIEHEVHLLQTNYAAVSLQNEKIEQMNQSLQELFQRCSSSTCNLSPISETEPLNVKSETSTQTLTSSSSPPGSVPEQTDNDEMNTMAELISDLVVKKLAELDAAE
jgi:hypothetical protein